MGRQAIVAGTGYPNNDGSSRADAIAKYVYDKMPVTLRRDKNNPYDDNAIAVLITTKRFFGLLGTSQMQIGYIKARAAASISKRIDAGEPVVGFVSSFDLYNPKWPRVSLTLIY